MAQEEPSPLEQRFAQSSKIGLPVVVLLGAIVAGARLGAPGAVLVLAGGALIAVIAAFWVSVRTLLGETPLSGADAYALGAPRAEEEQKRAVLRALKDLEFERSVGKISDEDYAELVARYRAEAKRLIRKLDEEAIPRREQVEGLVRRRLEREGLVEHEGADEEAVEEKPRESEPPRDEAKPKKKKKKKGALRDKSEPSAKADADATVEPTTKTGVACAKCGTLNDADAVFCKKCGARRASEEEAEKSDDAKNDDAEESSAESKKRDEGEES